jgi:hypothetical protein
VVAETINSRTATSVVEKTTSVVETATSVVERSRDHQREQHEGHEELP